MGKLSFESARTQAERPEDIIRRRFSGVMPEGSVDALFTGAAGRCVIGVCGLERYMPVCIELVNDEKIMSRVCRQGAECILIVASGCSNKRSENYGLKMYVSAQDGEIYPADADEEICGLITEKIRRLAMSPGTFNDKGELILDLKSQKVGLHYPVNLLLGDRAGYEYPLITTPKSSVDQFGRGAFRAAGGDQVLASRYVLEPEESGEPANRQFYLFEGGRQIFWSADAEENVRSAECCHSQNRTVIRYETCDGLEITRTIFILPQEDGMPDAAEVQRITVKDLSGHDRSIRIVATGVFGMQGPGTIAQDVVYANLVAEGAVLKEDGHPFCLTLNSKPAEDRTKKRFAMIISGGEPMDEYCTGQSGFIGSGTLARPEHALHLSCTLERKMASFFALAKQLEIPAGKTVVVDTITGLCYAGDPQSASDPAALADAFRRDPEKTRAAEEEAENRIYALYCRYRDRDRLDNVLGRMTESWDRYCAYLQPETGDEHFDSYVHNDLPFQVLYQTYVSRSFAWTQKAYRETGFREIQDIYASMYYMCANGQSSLVRELISTWITNVWEMGYANHNFTFRGKEPGDCSDDQLWLLQAVYRYVKLTGDTEFLSAEYSIEGTDRKRSLRDTIMAILTYSGKISVGKHGLPLLDKADWNDTLRLDHGVMQGPEKEALYRKQIESQGQEYGAPLENDLSESIMNAFLLKIAADEAAELASMTADEEMERFARSIAADVTDRCRKHAWKGDYYARCLINDGREFSYLGAGGDGLSADPEIDGSYFLNSYSWAVLADVATEEQIRIMLDKVNSCLRTDAGLKLCTLIAYEKLGVNTGTAFYFPGDRENCGVFKHAAMMAAVASMKAAKRVSDMKLAEDLRELAFFMMDKTMPYKTLEDPFVYKGNPRFCTQYNNSETGENIGPMLSGTASWLTLGVYEHFGLEAGTDTVEFSPLLRPGTDSLKYTVDLGDAVLHVKVKSESGAFRMKDGAEHIIERPHEGEHEIEIIL